MASLSVEGAAGMPAGRRTTIAGGVIVLVLLTAMPWGLRLDAAGAAPPAAAPAAGPGPVGYPTSPPAQVCGNAAMLTGPATQPPGSVRVDPGTNTYDATQANPPGTTFWLSPGKHTVGTNAYNQVIPKDNNTYIGAPGATLDGQGINYYAFTGRATGVTIAYLTIQNFVPQLDQGAVNHEGSNGWTVRNSTIQDVAGIAVNIGSNGVVEYSCLTRIGQTGINGFTGNTHVLIDHVEIKDTDRGPYGGDLSCGCKGGIKLFGTQDAVITNNWVHDNNTQGIWGDTNSVGFLIEGNYINNNDYEAILYETSYNALIRNNNILNNALVEGAIFTARNDLFPIAAVYLPESGGDSRMFGGKYSTLEVTGNNFDNNYGGVTLWEDANRFCNTPGNTAPGFCPIAGSATPATCSQGIINTPPYYADCRWHSQNVLVHNNVFKIDTTALGCVNTRCGENSIFSQSGSSPPWSPYLGDTVKNAITFNQNNRFRDNTYIGDWRFDIHAIGNKVSFTTWRGSPYFQDAGSTLNGARPGFDRLRGYGDLNGDGTTDLTVYRPGTGTWVTAPRPGAPGSAVGFGTAEDIPVPADYDGTGTAQLAFYRPSLGTWFIRHADGTVSSKAWGWPGGGDIPVPADYDGTGRAQLAAYRPGSGVWWVLHADGTYTATTLGTPGDVPVPGYYDGADSAQRAVYRPTTSTWWILHSNGTTSSRLFGSPGGVEVPVPADYDGTGLTQLALYRPASGVWRVLHADGSVTSTTSGGPGDIPVPGYFDGGSRALVSTYRPSTGTWLIVRAAGTESVAVGSPGDSPVALPYAIARYVQDSATTLGAPVPRFDGLRGAADLNGDGKTDTALYRPAAGSWVTLARAGSPAAGVAFGESTDVPVAGDYDGAGMAQLAVYRPGTGAWYVRHADGSTTARTWGWPGGGDIPVPADYDGTGKVQIAAYRPSSGVWWLLHADGTYSATALGTPGDVPVPGYYDGGAKAQMAVYRPSTATWWVAHADGTSSPTVWGSPGAGEIPVPADYDGSGKLQMAVYQPATGVWRIRHDDGSSTSLTIGQPGDIPVPGYYEGTARAQPAVYRPGTGTFLVDHGGTTETVGGGAAGDIPVALPSAVSSAFFPALFP